MYFAGFVAVPPFNVYVIVYSIGVYVNVIVLAVTLSHVTLCAAGDV